MSNFSMNMMPADEIYVTCKELHSTVVIAKESADLYEIAEDYLAGRFQKTGDQLVLMQSVNRDVANRVASAINVPISNVGSAQKLLAYEAWWVIRVSEELVVAKPAEYNPELGVAGMEMLAEFEAYKRSKRK